MWRRRSVMVTMASALLCAMVHPGDVHAQEEGVDLFAGEDTGESAGLQIESASGGGGSFDGSEGGGQNAMRLSFVRRNGSVFVRAKVQGKPVFFVLDTGASVTTLSPEFARSAGIAPSSAAPSLTVKTANGLASVQMGLIPRLGLGSANLKHVTFTTCDSCGGRLPGEKAPVVGLLGMNVLGRYVMRVNDSDGIVDLHPSPSFADRTKDISPWLKVGMKGYYAKPTSSDREVDLNFKMQLVNQAPRTAQNVILELTCYTSTGTQKKRTAPFTLRAGSSKKLDIKTDFKGCQDVEPSIAKASW